VIGMNTLQLPFLMAWWRHNCIASQVTKFHFLRVIS